MPHDIGATPPREPALAPQPGDGMVGLAALLCIVAVVGYWTGLRGVFGLLAWYIVAQWVSWLWHRDAPLGKVVCVAAVPPILLVYCLPKRLRRAVDALPDANDVSQAALRD
jgi:hypothetical protein